jgi:hypothetical protein
LRLRSSDVCVQLLWPQYVARRHLRRLLCCLHCGPLLRVQLSNILHAAVLLLLLCVLLLLVLITMVALRLLLLLLILQECCESLVGRDELVARHHVDFFDRFCGCNYVTLCLRSNLVSLLF